MEDRGGSASAMRVGATCHSTMHAEASRVPALATNGRRYGATSLNSRVSPSWLLEMFSSMSSGSPLAPAAAFAACAVAAATSVTDALSARPAPPPLPLLDPLPPPLPPLEVLFLPLPVLAPPFLLAAAVMFLP